MKVCHVLLGSLTALAAAGSLVAQSPALVSIEAPYPALQNQVTIAGQTWGPGAVAYGPQGVELTLHGANFASTDTVQFVSYKNGTVDPTYSVQVSVSTSSSTSLVVTVPTGAKSGLVTVIAGSNTSNPLPLLITSGTYGGSCGQSPPSNQLQITTLSLTNGTVGQSYSATLNATGGTSPLTWSLAGDQLPEGLSLSSGGVITGTPTEAGNSPEIMVQVTDSSVPPKSDEAALSMTVAAPSSEAVTPYWYSITNTSEGSGYDPVGNIVAYTDSVNGTWSGLGYDSLNRLTAGSMTPPAGSSQTAQSYCWSYDSFGNRTLNYNGPCTPGLPLINYNTNNQVTGGLIQYDLSGDGDVVSDSVAGNLYLYDAEGRLCAIQSTPAGGFTTMTGYLYDADGNRVAKGSISNWSEGCNNSINPATGLPYNGFTPTNVYILGQGSEQLTEVTSNTGGQTWQWAHTNVFAAGQLIATYDIPNGLPGAVHFQMEDWLGSLRMQTNYAGVPEMSYQSLPYGDGLTSIPNPGCLASNYCYTEDPTEHHYTGKERDSESGNDYFGARYYGSSMGRFMSPDPSGLLAQHPEDPQSWNLYAYARNNPLIYLDPNGLDCIYATDNGKGVESIDHDSDSGECGTNGGTWLSGYVDEDWAHYNNKAKAFEAASKDGGQVNFAQFQAGAQTNDSGNCLSGCGSYGFASAGADWLTGQLRGNSVPTDGSDPLDGLLTFMTARDTSVSGFWKMIAGPLNGQDNWAGPNGMGPPTGTGDWRAAVHDYNFSTNGITIQNTGYYFSPNLSPATRKALIQSNEQLMKTGGVQGAKEKGFFGIVNAYQWYMGSWQ